MEAASGLTTVHDLNLALCSLNFMLCWVNVDIELRVLEDS